MPTKISRRGGFLECERVRVVLSKREILPGSIDNFSIYFYVSKVKLTLKALNNKIIVKWKAKL